MKLRLQGDEKNSVVEATPFVVALENPRASPREPCLWAFTHGT